MYKYVNVCDIVKRFVSNMAWTWEFVPLMLPFMHTDRFCPLGRGGGGGVRGRSVPRCCKCTSELVLLLAVLVYRVG